MTFAPDWPIETERLLLRPFEAGDLDAFYEIHADEANARYLYNEPRNREQATELLERKCAGASVGSEGDWLSAAAALRTTGEVVADVSLLWESEVHRQGEIGFIVHPAQQGRGYATEAARHSSRSGSRRWSSTASAGDSRRATSARRGCSRSSGCGARRISSRTSG